ncbi:MAG TPA: S8 family serine peptidase [candidate division Zixibacteria bacterium]|nr:S8 family serine peptidase [candidate division Zixibacteria bacterium]
MRSYRNRLVGVLSVLLTLSLLLPMVVTARPQQIEVGDPGAVAAAPLSAPGEGVSHRLIVQLESPSLAEWSKSTGMARGAGDRLDAESQAAQAYLAQLEIEQAAFVSAMRQALPGAQVATYLDAQQRHVDESYQVIFNGMTVDPGSTPTLEARRVLATVPGVKAVFFDKAHDPALYASLPLINAQAAWDNPAIGGMANAGDGIRFASMDGGVHHDSPMFDGTGFSYPAGYPPAGSDPLNDNGKIITSRAYFRPWDGPAAGDENTWPGTNGTSHGVHTSSTAAGNEVEAGYSGAITYTISGVAPAAYVMSYRVFYNSVTGDGSFYDAEGMAALEDIVLDGAQVLNNSWGGGPNAVTDGYDVINIALVNAADAGVFISMSAGNSGPGNGTTDHPSPDYINVAASTTDGTISSGAVNVTGPGTVPQELVDMPFGVTTDFGTPLEPGDHFTYTFVASVVISPTNFEGCLPWPAGTFSGKAALISRGDCFFSDKIFNAQEAGAEFVIIYNHEGDDLISMACGDPCAAVTISGVFIGRTNGLGMVDWYTNHPADAEMNVINAPFQAGNVPDRIIGFSSRGPGMGYVLKPDIAAPGVNILAQGYDPLATGEDRHLGYGQASGTSMAAPHVAGAGVLLRQIHPTWSNAEIKSALMSTSKYIDIFNYDGTPAQPLDMGAGRLDLTNAADPGVILDPPSLSYGLVATDTQKTLSVNVTSVATNTQTYTVSLLYTGDGFPGDPSLPGFNVDPITFTLGVAESLEIDVPFDAGDGSYGHNQGFVILESEDYKAHFPVWALVTHDGDLADILLIDNDGSANADIVPPTVDYSYVYTETVATLGYTYDVLDADAAIYAGEEDIVDIVDLLGYGAVIYFTGDNLSNGLPEQDQYDLNTYMRGGGSVIASGQDLAAALGSNAFDGGTFFYQYGLGGNWLSDRVFTTLAETMVMSSTGTLPMAGMNVDIGSNGSGAGNQLYVDEIDDIPFTVPPLGYDDPSYNRARYVPIFAYPHANNVGSGTVGMAHSDQPLLEKPGVAYDGRAIYTSFGYEGINNDTGYTTREQLLQKSLDFLWDDGEAAFDEIDVDTAKVTFTAGFTSTISGVTGYSYRWDFGDGTAYSSPSMSDTIAHIYFMPGTYDVRLEVTDSLGNRYLATEQIVTTGYGMALPLLIGG